MPKQIILKSVKVKEVLLVPDGAYPFSVLYEILDDADNVVMTKRVQVKKEDMPPSGEGAMNALITQIIARLFLLEEL